MGSRSAAKRLLPLIVGAALFGGGMAAAATLSVALTSSGPQPLTATVNWGDTLEFVNSDGSPHSLQSTAPEIGSTTLEPGQTMTATFTGQTGLKRYTMSAKPRNFIFPAVTVQLVGSLDVTARSNLVTFGQSTQLVGHLVLASGATVTLQQRPLNQYQNGSGPFTPVGQPVATDSSGGFSIPVTPVAGTEYQVLAAAGQLASKTIKVVVAPAVTIAAPKRVHAGTRFPIRVVVRPATAVGSVVLESFVPSQKRWHPLGKGRLVHGRGTLKISVPRGTTKLHISIGPHEIVGIGYTSTTSRAFAVTGT